MATGTFPLIPRRRVIGLAFGGIRSVRRGSGSDVAGSRQYVPGDNLAWIDWAASARLSAARDNDEFIVHEFFADEAPHVVMVADRRPSMGIRASPLRRLDKPEALLESLRADPRERARDAQPHRLPRPCRRRDDLAAAAQRALRARRARSRGDPFDAPTDTVSRALEHLHEHRRELPTQTFVFVLSDFLVPPDEPRVAAGARAPLGARARGHPGSCLGAVVPRRRRPDGAVRRPALRRRRAGLPDARRSRRPARGARGAPAELTRVFRSLGAEPVVVDSHEPGAILGAFLRWADLPDDGAGSARMRRAAVTAAFAAVLAALAAVAPASAAGIGVPKVHGGSVLGQDLPLKVYASIDPGVHLFGDPITAQVAVVADRKWVAPANVHVIVHFHPYQTPGLRPWSEPATGAFCKSPGRGSCTASRAKCLPVTKTSDLARVFKFSPAHIEYVAPTGQVRYSLDARFPRIAVLSELSPSEVTAIQNRAVHWYSQLTPLPAPDYRVSPNLLYWLSLALAALLGATGLALASRWALQFRPARAAQGPAFGSSSLERALTLFFWARAHDDETLQRKALERVADELPYDVHDLSETARELAWSEETPEEEEVQEISERAGISRRNGEPEQ